MNRSSGYKACSLLILAALSALAPAFAQTSKIAQTEIRLEPVPLQPPFHDQFGTAVAASAKGNALAVSGITNDVGSVSEAGAILVYDRVQGNWVQTARLTAGDGQEDDSLGITLAISEDGNTVVAGPIDHTVTFHNEGAVYVGTSVDISGNTVIVGAPVAPGVSAFSGAAYVFFNTGNSWAQTAKLTAADGVSGDNFGIAVSIQGGTIAAGAWGHATSAGFNAGSAYLFRLRDSQWTQFAELAGSDVAAGGGFGGSIVFRNGTLLVGAPLQHPQANNVPYPEGEAYIYNVS